MPNEHARPLLVALHGLGGSRRTWDPVMDRLADRVAPLPLDLPGFGDSREAPQGVAGMADSVARAVQAAGMRRWLLLAHSMGAKVAAVLARRVEDGEAGLSGLCGLVLAAGSPPGPEPMADARRAEMLGWFRGNAPRRRADAARFIQSNTAGPLTPGVDAAAVTDLVRMSQMAWAAWLEGGSREDWRSRVGVLNTPTLLVAGAEDADLGPAAQRQVMAPHFSDVAHAVLDGARHLLPLERPDGLAALIEQRVQAR